MADEARRPTAADIFEGVLDSARDELARTNRGLALSGLAAGLGMGFTGLGVASVRAILGTDGTGEFVSLLFYPLGFVVVIVGRQQLFTENTLYPVALALTERRRWPNTLRLWAVVFAANVAGTILFAALATETGALGAEIVAQLETVGARAEEGPTVNTFFSAVFGGWMVALVAWLITAAGTTFGQVSLIWLLTFLVGVAHLDHCIASSAEILCAVLGGEVSAADYAGWLGIVTAGNILGGVFIVTVLNYGQVVAGTRDGERDR